MKKRFFMCLGIVFFLLSGVCAAIAQDYRIGAGDVLEISVWKNADLTRQLTVLPDGKIQFPLVKELSVEGLTVKELETVLLEKLKKYVPEPDLTISVLQVNSMMIYVIGKVNQPGRFVLNDNIDVLQALAVAGGLNPFAKEKEIQIFRKSGADTRRFNFNYIEVCDGINIGQNITLERGDVIVVR
ncbi:MAG: polysaccharide export protein [Proteobacteria bacterium]|nr:polysaccharide export protein [Pseudomonadota bacterium]MBU1388541.1 polysaccharide export protein [Pseudomonadota bacterium]MBU1544838.1 polysaccharide export protein [Pseudomonadota bacterium]MBU2482683.1 polysaccharide export protein [Pseudomonadota bacterium]